MNNLKYIVWIFLSVCLLGACTETDRSGDMPVPIETYIVTPIHGGAIITYQIPTTHNILFVMVEYERNGKVFTERSSIYKNSITIEGFNTTDPVSATLYTVSRDDEIKSDPINVVFTPLESPISLTGKSTVIVDNFGGIVVSWENTSKIELGVRLMVMEEGVMVDKDIYFSNTEYEKHPFRGFENIETTFALVFEDKWGNVSDTLYHTGIPYLETEVEKPWVDMRGFIPYDNVSNNGNYTFNKIWDGVLRIAGNTCSYLSVSGQPGNSVTFDLKQVVKLSRMIFWMCWYDGNPVTNVFTTCNITEFEMWGTKEIDNDKLADRSYWLHPFSAAQTGETLPEHTFMDDWVYLGRYEMERLDLLGASVDVMEFYCGGGWAFDIPIECDPVRYIRFFPLRTANGGSPPVNNYWWIAELSFFGDNTVSQE